MEKQENEFAYEEPKSFTVLMPVRLDGTSTYSDTARTAREGIASRLEIPSEKVRIKKISYKLGDRESLLRVVIRGIQLGVVECSPVQAANWTVVEDFECDGDITSSRVVDVLP